LIIRGEIKQYYVDENNMFLGWEDSIRPEKFKKITNAFSQWCTGEVYVSSIEFHPKRIKYKNFPSLNETLELLFSELNLKKYNQISGLRSELKVLYSELSKFVHDRVHMGSKSSLLNARFNEKEFQKWFEYLKRVYLNVSTILLLLFPQLLDCDEATRFKKYFPKEHQKIDESLNSS
jgi:hypothetical protein